MALKRCAGAWLRKRRLYEQYRIPEYWFVDLDADRVEVYVLGEGRHGTPIRAERGDALRSVALDGFATDVADLLVA